MSFSTILTSFFFSDLALLGMCLTDKGQFHLIEGNGKAAMECFMKGYGISVFLHGFKGVQVSRIVYIISTAFVTIFADCSDEQ